MVGNEVGATPRVFVAGGDVVEGGDEAEAVVVAPPVRVAKGRSRGGGGTRSAKMTRRR